MRYLTIKMATVKLLALFIGVCVLFGVLLITGGFGTIGSDFVSALAKKPAVDYNSNENRVTFLKGFGWEINENPVLEKTVGIPKMFDNVYTKYNIDVQLPGGYDLTKYAGRKATLYCYKVLNYPTDDEVFANVIVYEGNIIGGDISSAALDGFMHGFKMPDGLTNPTNAQLKD